MFMSSAQSVSSGFILFLVVLVAIVVLSISSLSLGVSCRLVCLPDLNCIGLSLNLRQELFMYHNIPGLLMYLLIIFEH